MITGLLDRFLAPLRSQGGRLLVLGLLAGVLGGGVAGAFDAVRAVLGMAFLGTSEASLAPGGWRVLLAPIVGGGLAGLLLQIGRQERPLGTAGLIERIQLRGSEVDWREGAFTAGAAALALGSGHSGGREAPVAGLSAGIWHRISHRLELPPGDDRVLVAASAAAAIAASFNTPLGSAILAMEMFLGSFALRHFGPIVAATVSGTLVGQALLGERVAFHAPEFVLGHPAELLGYLGLGVLCGALSALFHLGTQRMDQWSDRPLSPVLRGALGGLVVGGLGAVGLTGVMGTGYPLIEKLVTDPGALGLGLIAALVVGKGLATLVMVGSRIGPGLFSPVLVLGALAGAVFGLALETWVPQVTAGSYALVAMGALAAAVFRSPLAMILVLFELTGDYAVVPTMMLTVAVAMGVSSGLRPGSLYDALLANQGIRLDREVPLELRSRLVGELMRTADIVRLDEHPSLEEVADAFHGTRENLVWCVDGSGRYVGAIHVQDALDALTAGRGGELTQILPTLRVNQPASDAISVLAGLEVDEVGVVDADGMLVGVLDERALLGALRPPA